MTTQDRLRSAGRRRAEKLRRMVGERLELRRQQLGLSLEQVAAAMHTSRDRYRRWELARGVSISLEEAAVALRLLGDDLSCGTYPAGATLRDVGHARLISRFLTQLPSTIVKGLEVPIPIANDLRAWDVVLAPAGATIGVAAETRLRDGQDLVRRERHKARDSGVTRLLLILADTHSNRRAVAAADGWLRAAFPTGRRAAWEALRHGRDPGGDALLFA